MLCISVYRADPRLLGGPTQNYVDRGEGEGHTHLSVFHSALNHATRKALKKQWSLPQLAMLSTRFFYLEQETLQKFTLHDLTVFHVERVTALYYNKLSNSVSSAAHYAFNSVFFRLEQETLQNSHYMI